MIIISPKGILDAAAGGGFTSPEKPTPAPPAGQEKLYKAVTPEEIKKPLLERFLPDLPSSESILKQSTRISIMFVVFMVGLMAFFNLLPSRGFRKGG